MKKISVILFTAILLLFVPSINTRAQEYNLKQGKAIKAAYAGENESDYNYFKITSSKNGYIEIKTKTSNKKDLVFDICDNTKQVVAANIKLEHGEKVLHKVKKGNTYYIRTKGELNQTHSMSYNYFIFKTLSYAKKYSYYITNASMNNPKNPVLFEIKIREAGIMSFMENTSDKVSIKFLNKNKKTLTKNFDVKGNALTGLGVSRNTTYYACMWNNSGTNEGVTKIKNLKYQVRQLSTAKYESRGNSKELTKNKKAESLIIAGKKTTNWYELELNKEQKINISFESRLFKNGGVKIYICNEQGKVLHKNAILISEEMSIKYKKKYKMVYPIKTITTGNLPKGTYYIKIVSNSNKTTGSYAISWK